MVWFGVERGDRTVGLGLGEQSSQVKRHFIFGGFPVCLKFRIEKRVGAQRLGKRCVK